MAVRRTVGERRLLGSLAPVATPTAARTPRVPVPVAVTPTPRRTVEEMITQPVRTVAPSPASTLTPAGVYRQPGFYNPDNVFDTGRSGEKNPERARAAGDELFEDLPGWDYDLGRPLNANSKLNSQGYYDLIVPQAGGGGASGIAGGSSSDPMLQKIRALSQQSLANARSQAAALRKQASIDTGDENIARQIGLDEGTIAATAANPFSRRKNFLNDALAAETELEQGLNADNLFYSGHRVNQLSELGRRRAEGEANIGADLRSQLALIDENLASAEYQAQQQELEAQRQAMLEALAEQRYQAMMASLLASQSGGYDDYSDPGYDEPAAPAEALAEALAYGPSQDYPSPSPWVEGVFNPQPQIVAAPYVGGEGIHVYNGRRPGGTHLI